MKIHLGIFTCIVFSMMAVGLIGLPSIIRSSASLLPSSLTANNFNFYQQVLAQSSTTAAGGGATPSQRPNFLLIMGDDFGYSDIGAFGSEISTPHLDALAKDGKIFPNYHTAPTCSPARVSLLTGVDWHIGGIGTMYEVMGDNQKGKPGYETYINNRVVTVAELLRDAGYNTMMAGKWHLSGNGFQPGTSPHERGFSNSLILAEDGSNKFTGAEYIPGWKTTFLANDTKVTRPQNGTFEATMYTDQLLNFLKKTQSDNKPFFAYLAFETAHTPFQAPIQLVDKYDKIYSVGWDKIREQRFDKQKELGFWPSDMTLPTRYPPNVAWSSLSQDQKNYAARVLAAHAAMIEAMDQNIGRVIQYLKDTGQYNNTFIMFSTDNGSSEPVEMTHFKSASGVDLSRAKQFAASVNNGLHNIGNPNSDTNYGPWGSYVSTSPLSGFKTSFYEGGVRVPLLIKPPQETPSSSPSTNTNTTNQSANVNKAFVYVKDFTPTILEYANVQHPSTYQGHAVAPMEGKSLKGLLEGKVNQVYASDEPVPGELFNQTSVRMGDWVGIHDARDKTGVWKLFNLANDLGQNTNVADQHPDIIQKMKTVYEKFAKDVGVVIPTSGPFSSLFPPVSANNPQTISLADMLAPGYWKGNLNQTVVPEH